MQSTSCRKLANAKRSEAAGFGRSRECDCHKQWRADHTTKYHYCNLLSSSRDQISLLSFFKKTPNPFSLDFLSLSVLILCLMIQRTQRKASIGYDILFANSRDIYVLQGSGYKKISLFHKSSNLQNKLIVDEDGTVRLALDLDWGA